MSSDAAIADRAAPRALAGVIPPELEAACASALASDAAARPTANELAKQIERYLNGDRDLALRHDLAASQLVMARSALESDAVGGRAAAMRHAGHALALDPASMEAAELVTRLIIDPPAVLPDELRRVLDRRADQAQQRQARVAMFSFAAIAIVIALGAWNGVRSVTTVVQIASLTAILAAVAFRLSRGHASRREMLFVVLGNATLAALMSRMFGSLIGTPAVICVMALSLTSYPQLIDRARTVVAILLASWLLPVALERVGAIPSTWSVDGERIVSTSAMFDLAGMSTSALVIATNVFAILVISLFANALARSRRDAQREVETQAWHLRQLLPSPRA